jgi:hypothetical protein
MFAARSVVHTVNFMFTGGKTLADLVLKQRVCGLLHPDCVLSPLLTVVDQAVSAYHPAKEIL